MPINGESQEIRMRIAQLLAQRIAQGIFNSMEEIETIVLAESRAMIEFRASFWMGEGEEGPALRLELEGPHVGTHRSKLLRMGAKDGTLTLEDLLEETDEQQP